MNKELFDKLINQEGLMEELETKWFLAQTSESFTDFAEQILAEREFGGYTENNI
jgi:hypothetical protein